MDRLEEKKEQIACCKYNHIDSVEHEGFQSVSCHHCSLIQTCEDFIAESESLRQQLEAVLKVAEIHCKACNPEMPLTKALSRLLDGQEWNEYPKIGG